MVKPVSISAIERATDSSWRKWCAFFESANAAKLDHSEIVKLAITYKPISGWWAQNIAVAYEQHIGRRQPGQASDGLFSASVSRTVPSSQQSAYDVWCEFASGLKAIGGVSIAAPPTTSATPKRLYWRCKMEDGSAVSLGFETKAPEKVLVAVEHGKLGKKSDIDDRKRDWSTLIDVCFTR